MTTDTLFDVDGALIIGAGLAGLFTALKLAPMPATVLSPMDLGDGAASAWAQGGVAAALAPDDSPDLHAKDTVAAGAGTVDLDVAAGVAAEAAARIEDLARIGVPFDRTADGRYSQSREAAHSARRVIRVKGDTAGQAIMDALIAAVRATPSIRVVEGVSVDDLALDEGRVAGVFARRSGDPWGQAMLFRASAVVLATGGIGGLYAVTSNPARVRGQGLGMAARAGAVVRDPEFVQFHPTGLAVADYPTPLASEALRGEGAMLIDETGARFMTGLHPDGDLAPRDVVARGIHRHLRAGHRAFLDTRAALGAEIDARFPTIAASCRASGIDPTVDPIPVHPIQHYHMGGVRVDSRGRTALPGLWAVGEVASTGLHGANRLASNSLLEGLVFGARAAEDIAATQSPRRAQPSRAGSSGAQGTGLLPADGVARLRRIMADDVAVERDEQGLRRALAAIDTLERESAHPLRPFLNMTAAATLVAAAALQRRESRGGHHRRDYPERRDAFAYSTETTLAEALEIRAAAAAAGDAIPEAESGAARKAAAMR
ncbi:MAG: L-aspartate oxidase [Pseudomonadota bacterium]